MERIAFFDTKPYDRIYFDKLNRDFELVYFESRLRPESVKLAEGCRAVCAFVNDDIGASTVRSLADIGVEMIAMRCAGYNNVALKEAAGKLRVVRVPAYSPYAVAEHAMGMILMLNRKSKCSLLKEDISSSTLPSSPSITPKRSLSPFDIFRVAF